MSKPPPIDFDRMVQLIDGTRRDRADSLKQITNLELARALERVVATMDTYIAARDAGDEAAPMYLDNARSMLLGLMGVS